MPKRKTQQELMLAKGYHSLTAAAKALGLARMTLWRWAQEGTVKHVRVASRIYLEEKSLILYVGAEAAKLLRVGG